MRKLLLFLLLPVYVCSQSQTREVSDRIKKVENSLAPSVIYGDTIPKWNIEERMKQSGTRGLTIAVIRNYKIEWAKGYGWADAEENRRVNTETRFQAASISKSLNSLGVLKLAEQGKIDTGADINNYLKTWKFPYDSVSKGIKITVNNLLSHTAGLGIHGFPGYERTDPLPTVQRILNGEKPANTKAVRSLFEPGKKFQYSGGGTTITQLIITDITGRRYDDYMQEEVLKPLGMTNSSYRQPALDTANLATGYHQNGKPVTGKYHVYPEQAAAGLWTTPTDLSKYIIECQLALEGKSHKVLSQQMMKKRLTPYLDKDAAGLGVFIEDHGGKKYFNHNGGNEAFLCTSFGSLEGGNGVVIMVNGEVFEILIEVLNSVAQVYEWKDFYKPQFKKLASVPEEVLKQYVGDYKLMNDTLTISFCGKELCIQQNHQPATGYKMTFSDNSSFAVKEVPDANFTVLRDKDGKIEGLQLKQGETSIRIPKVN